MATANVLQDIQTSETLALAIELDQYFAINSTHKKIQKRYR